MGRVALTVWWWGIELSISDDAGLIPGRNRLFFFWNPLSRVDMFQHTFHIKQYEVLAGIIQND
jgi:hypothetical protein